MKGWKARLWMKLKLIPTINYFRKGFDSQPYTPQPQPHHHHHQQQTFPDQNLHSTQPVNKDQDCKINNKNIYVPEPVINPDNRKGKETDHVSHEDNEPTPKIEPKETISSNTIAKDETIPEIVNIETEEEHLISLEDFEEKCPPGGEDSVVLYTTSLRGIRKTFEDCRNVGYLLSFFKILVHERDVSMDMEFRDELWRMFGEKVVPPKLFIKGRYIGGAEEVIGLHEEGKLKKLLEGIPWTLPKTCTECANMKFMVCPNCDGSRKIFAQTEDDNGNVDDEELILQCPDCNENGLVKCPICC